MFVSLCYCWVTVLIKKTSQCTAPHIFNPLNMSETGLLERYKRVTLKTTHSCVSYFVVTQLGTVRCRLPWGGAPGLGPIVANFWNFSPESLVILKWFTEPGRERDQEKPVRIVELRLLTKDKQCFRATLFLKLFIFKAKELVVFLKCDICPKHTVWEPSQLVTMGLSTRFRHCSPEWSCAEMADGHTFSTAPHPKDMSTVSS